MNWVMAFGEEVVRHNTNRLGQGVLELEGKVSACCRDQEGVSIIGCRAGLLTY